MKNGTFQYSAFVYTDHPTFAQGSWFSCRKFPVVICQVAVFGVQFPYNSPRLLFSMGKNMTDCCGLIGALSIWPLVTQIDVGSLSPEQRQQPGMKPQASVRYK